MIVISGGKSVLFHLRVRWSSNILQNFHHWLRQRLVPAYPVHSNLAVLEKTVAHRAYGLSISRPETGGFPWRSPICLILLSRYKGLHLPF